MRDFEKPILSQMMFDSKSLTHSVLKKQSKMSMSMSQDDKQFTENRFQSQGLLLKKSARPELNEQGENRLMMAS